jgi:hypothetical protein
MNSFTLSVTALTLLLGFACSTAQADPSSEFDETAIRTIQEGRPMAQSFATIVQAFEASTDPTVKAAKWEELVVASAEGLLTATWPTPAGGWKLIDFPTTGTLTLQDVRDQAWKKAEYTKLVAQNETEAVRLRGAGALMLSAASDGQQWASKLLLDIAQRPDSNIKRLTYWFTKSFAQDASVVTWPVDWSAWQQAYTAANPLGKAIILRSITTLAVRRNEVATAAAINLSALSGTDRELKAVALAFGDPALGSAVTAKWAEIAGNASDAQLQALAQEVRAKSGITD